MKLGRSASLLLALSLVAAGYSQVGRVTAQRNALLRAGSGPAAAIKVNSGVNNGDTLQTGRRGFAELTFRDTSMIRINELTEMVVQDASALRRVRLNAGVAWVKDRNGGRTSIQTPVGTATARGTEYVVTSDGKVDVIEGEVDLENAGQTITLHAGESGGFNNLGQPFKLGDFRFTDLPRDSDGSMISWWVTGRSNPSSNGSNGSILGGISGLTFPIAFAAGSKSSPQGAGAVPEPASVVVLTAAAVAMALRKRK